MTKKEFIEILKKYGKHEIFDDSIYNSFTSRYYLNGFYYYNAKSNYSFGHDNLELLMSWNSYLRNLDKNNININTLKIYNTTLFRELHD